MATLTYKQVVDDLKDRLDNAVDARMLGPGLRSKLEAPARIRQAVLQGMLTLALQLDAASLSGLMQTVNLDTPVNTNDEITATKVKVYAWPAGAYSERPQDAGLVNLILNGKTFGPESNLPQTTVQYMAASGLYGVDHPVYAADTNLRQITLPSGVTGRARILSRPALAVSPKDNDDTKFDESLLIPLGDVAYAEAIKIAGQMAGDPKKKPEPQPDQQA